MAERGLAQASLQSYRADLKQVDRFWKQHGITWTQVHAQDIQLYLGWRQEQGFAATSTARCLSCLRRVFRYFIQQQWITDDPSRMTATSCGYACATYVDRTRC